MKVPNFLYLVEDGDHSLRLTKRRLQVGGETQDSVDQRILAAIRQFVASTFPHAQSGGEMRNPGGTS